MKKILLISMLFSSILFASYSFAVYPVHEVQILRQGLSPNVNATVTLDSQNHSFWDGLNQNDFKVKNNNLLNALAKFKVNTGIKGNVLQLIFVQKTPPDYKYSYTCQLSVYKYENGLPVFSAKKVSGSKGSCGCVKFTPDRIAPASSWYVDSYMCSSSKM